MTLVVALGVLVLVSLIGWQTLVGGAWTSNHLAVVAALAALASIGRVILGGAPGVEPVTPVVICVTIVLGLRMGIAVGVLAVLCSNLVLGHGPWTAWQIAGYVCVALVAQLFGRAQASQVELAILAGVAALAYDVLLNYGSVIMFIPESGGGEFARNLVLGIPFMVVHVVSAAAMTAAIGPPVIATLQRARRRLDARVG